MSTTNTTTVPPSAAAVGATPNQSQGKQLKWIETSTHKTPEPEFSYEAHYDSMEAHNRMAKVMKNPLIPFGMLATVAALALGIRANLRGDRFRQQMMMRYRVGFQAFTVIMLAGGLAAAQVLVKNTDDDD